MSKLFLPFILVVLTLGQATLGAEPDADEYLRQATVRYQRATTFRFERKTTVTETPQEGKPRKLLELSFVTAKDKVESGRSAFTRLEIEGNRGKFVLADNGKRALFYSSRDKEYVEGENLTSVKGTIATSLLASLHWAPLWALGEDKLTKTNLSGREKLMIENTTRDTVIVEGQLPGQDSAAFDEAEIRGPVAVRRLKYCSPTQFTTLMSLQGLSGDHGVIDKLDVQYSPLSMMRSKPAGKAFPTEFKLWIDREDFKVWRTKMTQKTYKKKPGDTPTQEEVTLVVDDVFNLIEDAIPDGFFDFAPPEDARKVDPSQIGK